MRIPQRAVKLPSADAVRSARWFAGKHRPIARLRAADVIDVPESGGSLVLLDVHDEDGTPERYLLTDVCGREAEPQDGFWGALLAALADGPVAGTDGRVELSRGEAFEALWRGPTAEHVPATDQSNTLVALGGRLVIKVYRRLQPGPHPEVEVLEALQGTGAPVPAFAGAIHHVDHAGVRTALALLQEFIPEAESGWEAPIERAAARLGRRDADEATSAEYRAAGAVVAELHAALAAAFGMRPANAADGRRWLQTALADLGEASALDPLASGAAPRVRAALEPLRDPAGAPLTRIHGDLHQAQLLRAGGRVLVIDFEGDPTRPLAQRRDLDTPLRDLAGLLRSVDHVGSAAARRAGRDPASWVAAATAAAVEGYSDAAPVAMQFALLEALEVAKECRELVYAHRVLPEWAYVAQQGLERLLARPAGAGR
jgi:maltokinase